MDAVESDFEQLPVVQHQEEILDACRSHQVVICIGETGRGKTTKIPQVLIDFLSFCPVPVLRFLSTYFLFA